MLKFTAIYLRVSTDRQTSGIESQERALKEYCHSQGFRNLKIFCDNGISGAKSSRPALDELMVLVNNNQVDRVIVYSFSRFARSTSHLLSALKTFKARGVGFVSFTENIDTSQPMGQAIFTIIAAMSELERDLIRERVTNGLKNARAKGKQLGRKRTRNSELIRELRKKNMSYRQISNLTGYSLSTVCRELRSFHKLQNDNNETFT